LPCAGVTAWNALVEQGHVRAGETVLLLGTGGVSMFALQIARLHGARVIVTSSSDEKLARARALGADEVINYKATPDWDKRAKELNGGRGVDHVVEVGGVGTFEKSLNAVRGGGRISYIGTLAGIQGPMKAAWIFHKHLTIQGIFVGSRAMLERLAQALSQREVKPVVDKVFALNQAKEAFAYLASGAHVGKVIVRL
jgi:NADPH:quinone reductase-like Zn-dependent oxidoreductase